MAKNELFDHSVSRWLEEAAPPRIPDRVLHATFERTRKSRQHVGWRAFLGRLSMPRFLPALGGAAVIVVVTVLALNFFDSRQPGIGAASPTPPISSPEPTASASPETNATASPEPTPAQAASTPPQATGPIGSTESWPQATTEELQEAQSRADAGDPDYTWQVDAQLVTGPEDFGGSIESGVKITERFLRDELGWDAFMFNSYQGFSDDGGRDGVIRHLVYLRCASGETNSLYPISGDEGAFGAERCAPTIDELRYETVSIDLSQPVRRGADGIWVVSRWRMTAPFAQADPELVQAEAEARLAEFLQARVNGRGGEGYVDVAPWGSATTAVPLLYATTGGAPYERYEIERLGEPTWPYSELEYAIRLFSRGGDVVEQIISTGSDMALVLDARRTTQNGQPVPVRYGFLDGQLSIAAPYPWTLDDPAHWLGLRRDDQREELIELLGDPQPVGEGCASGATAADAEALAQAIESDPDLVATAPVAVTLLGQPALSMDVTAAPGASVCEDYPMTNVLTYDSTGRRRGLPIEQGSRIRLYLLDAPPGSSFGILGIVIMAPGSRFDDVIADATPIIESMGFGAP